MKSNETLAVSQEDEKQAANSIRDWATFFIGLVPLVAATANSLYRVFENVYDFVSNKIIKEN